MTNAEKSSCCGRKSLRCEAKTHFPGPRWRWYFFAQWIFVQIAPFLSSQDFRYSVILLRGKQIHGLDFDRFIPKLEAEQPVF
jgi:hypothetical protein